MPATMTGVLNVARREIGYRERAGNRTKFGEWYGLDGVPWCAQFVSWVADKANAEDIIPRHAYTPAGAAWFVKHGRWSQSPRRGDIVYYEFPGMHRISHVGIVEHVHSDGSITAIEGNTDFAGGRTGGRVMRKRRSRSLVAGFGHPDYSTARELAVLHRKAAAESAARAKASRLAKARGLAAKKAAEAKARAKAAAALAAKNKAAAAVAAAALLLAGGGTGAVLTDGSTPMPAPSATATSVATSAPTPSPTSTAMPRPTPTPTATKRSGPKPHVVKPAPRPTLHRVLKYTPGGKLQTGADVRVVQRLVGAREDGQYGRSTTKDVRAWQRQHHLKPDGEFGQKCASKAGMEWIPRQ